jgi:hypothetical protein
MSSSGAAVGFPGANADSTGVIVISGSALVGVSVGTCDGTTVAVGFVAVGLCVGDDSSDGTAVADGVTVEAVAQAFRMRRKDKIQQGIKGNFRMNTSGRKWGYSAEFWLTIALKP